MRTMAPFTDRAFAQYLRIRNAGGGRDFLTECEKSSAIWWLRTTREYFGREETCFVFSCGTPYSTNRAQHVPLGVRPVLRLDAEKIGGSGLITPCRYTGAAPDANKCAFMEVIPNDIRTLDVSYSRHDDFNRFDILWDRFLTDTDGERYRCAVSFSEAYDFSEGFNVFLIPESYDFKAQFDRESSVRAWPRMNDLQWESGNGFKVHVLTVPETNSVIWQVDRELWYWAPPFMEGSEATAKCLNEYLPEDFDLGKCVRDEKGRLCFDPEGRYTWDVVRNLFVWQIDGKEYYSYPEMMWTNRRESRYCELSFTRNAGPIDLYIPPWVRELTEAPGETGCRVEADTLLLAEGVEYIQMSSLKNFSHIRRLIIPESVTMAETLDYDGANVDEALILGDPDRILRWFENVFEGCACEKAYEDLYRRVQEKLELPERTDGGFLLTR